MEKCNELNSTYNSHIKVFGTEAWKKVSRLAIAIAGYLVSTDDDFENIIVSKEHVDCAVDYLVSIYDNASFKFKEYVELEHMYDTIDEDGVQLLQDIYNKNPSIVIQLERISRTNKQNLMAATGLSNDDYNAMMRMLTKGLFIQFDGYDILPTQRFRLGTARVNRLSTTGNRQRSYLEVLQLPLFLWGVQSFLQM